MKNKVINPIKKYKTLEKASEALGFSVEIPERYKIKQISVIADKILQLEFASVIVRKAKYTAEFKDGIAISGVYEGGYPNDCNGLPFSQYAGQEGIEYWNGSAQRPKVYLAVYNINKKFVYSVYAPKGIKIKTMAKWEAQFK